jgi:potassium-dependent mechanosensitive channel
MKLRQRPLRSCLVALLFLHLGGANAGEQQASPIAEKPSPESTPIPLSEIASETESTLRTVQTIQATISRDQITDSVQRNLPSFTNEIGLRGAEMSKFLGGVVPLELLHSMEIVLENYREQLSSWNRDLTERSKTLDNQIVQLDRLSQIWKSTLKSPDLSKTAPEIPGRVQSLVDSISRTTQDAKSLREKTLELQGRVLEASTRLQTFSPAFEQAEASAINHVFDRDSPPLWDELDRWREANRTPLIPPASSALFKTYLNRHSAILSLHAAIILLLALFLFWVRRRIHKYTGGEADLRQAARVFDLPISTAVTLSFLILGSLYSTAPFLVRAILWGILLICIAVILRRLTDRALFPMLNALIILYFVDQFRLLTSLLPLVGRLIFSAEMLGGTLFLCWAIQKTQLPVGERNSHRLLARTIRLAIKIGLVVFPVTLLANIIGYVNFANLLGGGAIRSAYVAASIYTGLLIVEGLIIISLATRPLNLVRVVQLNRLMLQRRICGVAGFFAFLYWASFTLSFFGLREPLVTATGTVLGANFGLGSFNLSLQQVLVFLVTVWAAFAISRFLRFLLEEDIYHHWQLARGIPQAISTIVHYAVLLIGFFVSLAVLGVDLTKVTILAGAFSVGIGFGLQTVINNFVCGLILLFERPIKIGDVIQIDTDIGEVLRIGIRACVIRTTDGSEVIVPNGTIIANKVTNWTFSDRYRAIELPVTVARGSAPQQVIEILKRVAADQPGIAKEPAPEAYVVNFGVAAVSFNLRAWTDRYQDWIQVRSDLSVAVDEELARAEIAVA